MERLVKILFFIGLAVYFVILVVLRTPAQWGASAVLNAVPNLSMTGISGTVWSGNAAAAYARIDDQVIDLGPLRWRLNGMSLLGLRACVDVQSDQLTGTLCRGMDGATTVQQLLVDQIPASLLNRGLMVNVDGTAGLTISNARFTSDGTIRQLDGNLSWQRARVNAGEGWFLLGSFAADLSTNDQGDVLAHIMDFEGEFEVDLQAVYTPGHDEPKINGIIRARPNASGQLVSALSLFAETLDDGSYRVTWPMGG